jgi:transposase-like protein
MKDEGVPIVQIARTLKVSRATVHRHLDASEANLRYSALMRS